MSSHPPMASTAGPPGQSTVAGTPGDTPADGHMARGTTIDRYVVLDRVGEGGMGVVYAAYDPDLDRKVAIKVLHRVGHSESAQDVARTRMLREAQSLAKLSHPNVVAIHDVGTYATRAWIAMEFVDGKTLTEWLAASQRPWTEVFEVLLAIGDGVAAAHAAGVLHRDLKPDNVMVGDEPSPHGFGRVRVMDFGLARGHDTDATAEPTTPLMTSGTVLQIDVTRAGAVIGTPAYMAPEQLAGDTATVASDQFSYCVTMWEALFGARPFAATTIHEQLANILDHPPRRGPRRVPTWLRRILERGLAVGPAERHDSVAALLDALREGRRRARLRSVTAGVVGVAAVAAAGWGAAQWRDRAAIGACQDAATAIAAQWPGRQDDVVNAIARAGRGFATATAAGLPRWLDAFAGEWTSTAAQACIAAEVEGTLAPTLHGRARACLDVHAVALEALLDSLADGTPVAIGGAIRAASLLPDPTECGDPEVLARPPWSDGIDDRRVAEIRAELARADVVATFGASTAVVALDDELQAAAVALGWEPLVAETDLSRGRHLDDLSRLPQAEAALRSAYFGALRIGSDRIAARAATALVRTVGFRAGRYDEGLAWADHARAVLHRSGARSELDRAALDVAVAAILLERGDLDEARTLVEGSLAIREATLGENHPEVADALDELGSILELMGEHHAAGVAHQRALDIREAVFGPDHPMVAASLNNLANVAVMSEHRDEAERLLRRALEIGEAAYGPDDVAIAPMLVNLANLYLDQGQPEQARDLYARGLAAELRALGPDHKEVAVSHANLGGALLELHDFSGAIEHFDRARTIAQDRLGNDHPVTAAAHFNLGMARAAIGDYPAALAHSRLAVEQLDPMDGEAGVRVRLQVATILRAMDRLDEAERELDQLVAVHARRERPVTSLASDVMYERGELALARGDLATASARLQDALDLTEEPGGVPEARIRFAMALARLRREGAGGDAEHIARGALDVLERDRAAPAELTRARSRLDVAVGGAVRAD